ncbi:MAG: autotransporter outer membrane beta-barrel domain-containing protein, partial [Caulobacteraceae bacterium]
AVTLNSNNSVSNAGQIGFTNIDNAIGIQILGGFTGQVTNTGSILLTETYTAATDNNTGVLTGAFAQGSNRIGIQVTGTSPFTGGITSTGSVTINGDNSYGISIEAPITGDLQMQTTVPVATSGAAPVVTNGSVTMLGDDAVGVRVTGSGAIGGALGIANVSATGVGAQGVVVDGPVGGEVTISSLVSATGYRTTTRSSIPQIETDYTAQEMQQGGPAVSIGANIGGGLLLSAPTLPITTANSTQTTGEIISYGEAPALQIGASGSNLAIGLIGAGPYGIELDGSVVANGVFDQITSPNLPAPVPATAIQIGIPGGGAAFVAGGIHNTGGISATSYQANATAIHFMSGGGSPTLVNDGSISASSNQMSTSTSGLTPVAVDAILLDKGASLSSLVNNSGIVANITGTSGVGGTAGAIIDNSGTLDSITNTGTIASQATQTLVTQPLPITATAIDISQSTSPQTISQSVSPSLAASTPYDSTVAYTAGQIVSYEGGIYEAITAAGVAFDPVDNPSLWRQIGAATPSINGSIYFGSGGSTLDVAAGVINAPVLELGTGANTINIQGPAGSGVSGATVSGAVEEGPATGPGHSTLTINVDNGTLIDTNPNPITARSINVGANGDLIVAADPVHGTNTEFITSGSSTFAPGAQVGLALLSLPSGLTQTFTILSTVPGQGTLAAGSFSGSSLTNAPFLFNVQAAYQPSANPAAQPSTIALTVTRKSASQLGFNAAEGSSLNAVLAALPQNPAIESVILSQTTQSGLKSAYDQLLPNQGEGLFEALDAAAEAITNLTAANPNPNGAQSGQPSLWLQEVNERVNRAGINTLASNSKLFGLVGGYERPAAGGAVGVSLAYLNAQEQDTNAAVGEHVVASMVEAGAYYRRSAGPLTLAARAAGGYAWFSSNRQFIAPGILDVAFGGWNGLFADAHAEASYEPRFGRFYAGPELNLDFLYLHEGGYTETGDSGLNLTVDPRSSSRLSGRAVMVVGAQFGRESWLRTEFLGGYREIAAGQIGDTVASFQGGTPFDLAPDPQGGGWATVGIALKGGTPYSYVALEGDADFRAGEERYDVLVAGRSVF